MSAGLMHKLKNWVSGDPYDEDMLDYMDEYELDGAGNPTYAHPMTMTDYEPEKKAPKKNLKVIDHPNSNLQQHVIVLEPKAFEDALDMIEHLRNRKSVLLNLHMLDMSQSQRVVDFLSGATHAIEGHQQRIGDGVFMFTPANVMIESQKMFPIPGASAPPQAEKTQLWA